MKLFKSPSGSSPPEAALGLLIANVQPAISRPKLNCSDDEWLLSSKDSSIDESPSAVSPPQIRRYFFANTFAACAFARDAAFLCTTPDFTALSMAETYSDAAVLLAASSFAAISASSRFRNVLSRVLTPRLRSVRRTVLRAALIADFVLAMSFERLELVKNSNARS